MQHTRISLPAGSQSPFGPTVAIDRAVIASALAATPRAGEALAMAASAILFFQQHREALLAFAEIVTDLADMIDGDPDFEEAEPAEANGDERDASAIEWTTTKPYQRAQMLATDHEDDEQDDDPEEDDPHGQIDEDGINTAHDRIGYTPGARGAGCLISDQGIVDLGGFHD